MNTVEKGDKFEHLCFLLISDAINNLQLGIIPARARVFQKKGYYSKYREDEIIFDLSIEVWPEGADNYALLYLIECKDYNIDIPIGRVEEFHSKASQIIGLNGKGVFMTKKGFQQGALNFSRSKGIMLIQVNSNLTLNIILHKIDKYQEKKTEATINIEGSTYQDPIVKEVVHRRWKRLIDAMIIKAFLDHMSEQITEEKITIPILSSEEIEEITTQIIYGYNRGIIERGLKLIWSDFKMYLTKVFELEFIIEESYMVDSEGREILSYCSFIDKKIVISAKLVGTNRETFLIAHELGHFFLHNKIVLSQNQYEKFEDNHSNFNIDNKRNWLEWQANQFAANLAMPKLAFLLKFSVEQEKVGLLAGRKLYVDDQIVNQNSFRDIVNNLGMYFNVSKTSVIYRMNSLGLIDYNYPGKSIKEILANMLD